jgi:hypothetical protein
MDKFAIGEVVICMVGTISSGRDATIYEIRPNALRSDGRRGTGYFIDIQGVGTRTGGELHFAFADELRKKRPPRDDLKLVRWSECPWQPQTVNS